MSDSLSRRHVIIGVAAVSAAAIGAGAILFATADAKAALLEFFRRALPSVAIDTQSANACIDSFMTRRSTMKRHVLSNAWQTAGVELMAGLNEKFESASRKALTQFSQLELLRGDGSAGGANRLCQQAAECRVRQPFCQPRSRPEGLNPTA